MEGKILKISEKLAVIEFAAVPGFRLGDRLEIRKKKKNRTVSQNSLYWLFCEFVGNALFMTRDEVHSGFALENLKKIEFFNGRKFETISSTTGLTCDEFGAYMEHCNITAIEMGVDIEPFWSEYEEYRK